MIIRKSYAFPEPSAKEIYRYMGVHSEPDEAIKDLVKEAVEKLRGVVSCKVCYTKLPIERPDENTIIIGKIRTESVFLKKNLKDCSHAYLFFATIGNAPDRLIASMKHTPSKALALDASASAVVEELCDTLNNELKEEEAAVLTSTVIAKDGIAVIVNNNNTFEELSSEQVKAIFKGEITDWSELD